MTTASLLPAYLGMNGFVPLWLVQGCLQACCADLKRHFDGVLLQILRFLKSLLLSFLFWFMYSLIYLCTWVKGGRRRGKTRGAGSGRQRQLQCLLLYPRERLRHICLLKASATDRHNTAAERYKASSVAPKPPAPISSPQSIGTVCMFWTLRQKKLFFQLCPVSLKRVKWCCSSLWELQKPKARKKTHTMLLRLRNPLQTRAIRPEQGFCTQYARLSSAFACVCNRQRQASGRLWENR